MIHQQCRILFEADCCNVRISTLVTLPRQEILTDILIFCVSAEQGLLNGAKSFIILRTFIYSIGLFLRSLFILLSQV